MKILLAGFEPFGTQRMNSSWLAVSEACAPEGVELIKAELPVAFFTVLDELSGLIKAHEPDAVILCGEAAGASRVMLEQIAVNSCSGEDVEGRCLHDVSVIPGAPDGYFSTLPTRSLCKALNATCVPAGISHTASVYVCNHALFGVLHLARTRYPAMRVGLVHLPYLPEQAAEHPGMPSMAVETSTRGLNVILQKLASS